MTKSTNSQPALDRLVAQTTAYIGLGSNLGNRGDNIEKAVNRLEKSPDVTVIKVSSLIETTSVGGPAGQNCFLNGSAQILCRCMAEHLLSLMQEIEYGLGRERTENRTKWASRTIDLDLLLFGSEIIDLPHLKVPHPLMHTRMFIMEPMAEIAPEVLHPRLNQTMRQILNSLKNN